VTAPEDPDGRWGPVGSAVTRWLADGFDHLLRMVERLVTEPMSVHSEPVANDGALIAILALVLAAIALAVAIGTGLRVRGLRRRVTGGSVPSKRPERGALGTGVTGFGEPVTPVTGGVSAGQVRS
jgi:hypothetical protein